MLSIQCRPAKRIVICGMNIRALFQKKLYNFSVAVTRRIAKRKVLPSMNIRPLVQQQRHSIALSRCGVVNERLCQLLF